MSQAGVFDILYESPDGSTADATQPLLPLAWETATLTRRRRAPDTISIAIPRENGFGHTLLSFKAGRELRITRNGAHYWAGFMDAASPVVNARGRATSITLPGWGNAYALTLNPNSLFVSTGVEFVGLRTDQIIGFALDETEHGAGGDWFPAAGRTIDTGAYTLARLLTSGKNGLQVINEQCDMEGWEWRAGIDASGAFTFAAGAGVAVNRSTSLHLTGAASIVTGMNRDGSVLASLAHALQRVPGVRTQLNGSTLAGATTITVDSTENMQVGDQIFVGQGTANAEGGPSITALTATTLTMLPALGNAHADNETVEIGYETRWRSEASTENTTTRDDHHGRLVAVFDDSLQTATQRDLTAAAYRAAYDHVLTTGNVLVTDPTTIRDLLNAPVLPGDRISLTAGDRLLRDLWDGTTVVVQEMTLALGRGGCRSITLVVGDPAIDALAVLETRLRAANSAATSVLRG